MVKAFAAGDIAKAQKLHHQLYPLFKDLFLETNPIPVKAALSMMAIIQDELRLPMVPMTAKGREQLRAIGFTV